MIEEISIFILIPALIGVFFLFRRESPKPTGLSPMRIEEIIRLIDHLVYLCPELQRYRNEAFSRISSANGDDFKRQLLTDTILRGNLTELAQGILDAIKADEALKQIPVDKYVFAPLVFFDQESGEMI